MNLFSKFSKLFATGFYLGCLPRRLTGKPKTSGGGTLGTLLGLALVPLLPQGRAAYAVFLLAACVFAVVVAHRYCADTGIEDDQRVVLDETVGYWTAVAWLPHNWLLLALAFGLFRVFDGLKPWPIRQVDDNVGGGFGVVLDDVLAGVAANLVLRVLLPFLPFLR
jgi:phosphatidylglycerophosphatase A